MSEKKECRWITEFVCSCGYVTNLLSGIQGYKKGHIGGKEMELNPELKSGEQLSLHTWKYCKCLTEWKEEPHNRMTYEFYECYQILNRDQVPCSMDMIRKDTGKRIYFAGVEKSAKFIWADKKYSEMKS